MCRQHGRADARGRPRPPAKNENKTAPLPPLGPQDATRPWARRAPLRFSPWSWTRSEGRTCASTRAQSRPPSSKSCNAYPSRLPDLKSVSIVSIFMIQKKANMITPIPVFVVHVRILNNVHVHSMKVYFMKKACNGIHILCTTTPTCYTLV